MNQLDLKGRHAIVTGGAAGLGLAITQRFLASGAQVTWWDRDAAAMAAAQQALGKELADTGVRVNCVTPAAVKTAIFEQMSPEHIAFMLSKIPMGRFGMPEEVAAMVAWLCTDDCSFSTGAVFDLSGGRSTY
jgi:3-oxoacyl-[acyl-carrier protein] reductase